MPVADLDRRIVGEESHLAVHAVITKIRVFKLHRSAEAGNDLRGDCRQICRLACRYRTDDSQATGNLWSGNGRCLHEHVVTLN